MEQPRNTLLHRIIGLRLSAAPASPVCEKCGSDAVAVSDWEEAIAGHWRVTLRCGECDRWQEMTIATAAADRLIAALDGGLAAIARDLEAVERERMAAQIEAFVEALARDLIDAQDFA
jgi:hypothetical protein